MSSFPLKLKIGKPYDLPSSLPFDPLKAENSLILHFSHSLTLKHHFLVEKHIDDFQGSLDWMLSFILDVQPYPFVLW